MKEKTIGALSTFTGVSIHTIKYYEKIGLISSNRDEHSNYRSYNVRVCTDIYECLKYRNMDFSLKDTGILLKEADDHIFEQMMEQRSIHIHDFLSISVHYSLFLFQFFNLPAIKVLESENIFVMPNERALKQDIRPLKIIILNLMPTKITTETQLLRLLGNSPLQVDIELLQMASRVYAASLSAGGVRAAASRQSSSSCKNGSMSVRSRANLVSSVCRSSGVRI